MREDDDLRFGDVVPDDGGDSDPVNQVIDWIRLIVVLGVGYVVLDAIMTELIGIPLPFGV